MEQQNKANRFFEALSEEQLMQYLRMELISGEPDLEQIQRINAALSAKETHADPRETEDAWRNFVTQVIDTEPLYDYDELFPAQEVPEPRSRKAARKGKLVRMGLIAAIVSSLFLLGSFTASAFGFDLFGAIASWTEEHFSFTASAAKTQTGYTDELFAPLRAELAALGVTEDVLPEYFPEGFLLKSCDVEKKLSKVSIMAKCYNDMEEVFLWYDIYPENIEPLPDSRAYTKDGGKPDALEIKGISHYLMTNMNEYLAIWVNGRVECSITGFADKGELEKVIRSIY